MNILMTDDLLKLSVFKCKVCALRLIHPIMQVDVFGNICGICYERSVFINVVQNNELEALLSKLYLPCRYAESGCTFNGYYYKICDHELMCRFRQIPCPFFCEEECDDFLFAMDMPCHISDNHFENVLIFEDKCVLIDNPTEQSRTSCHLLAIDEESFLLRTCLDIEKQCMLYAFYHFKEDTPKNLQFFFVMGSDNSVFNVKCEAIIMPVSGIASMFNADNIWKFNLSTLESLNCLESIKIGVDVTERLETRNNTEYVENELVYYKCNYCSNFLSAYYVCKYCNFKQCQHCKNQRRSILGNCNHNFQYIETCKNGVSIKYRCQNEGCGQFFMPNKFYLHTNYLCTFKKYTCPSKMTNCEWQGFPAALRTHVEDDHKDFINRNVCTIVAEKASTLYFITEDNFFVQSHNLNTNGDLTLATIKLTAPHYDDSYTWEIHIKKEDMSLAIFGNCTLDRCERTVNVVKYMNEEKNLTFTTYIKRL